MADNYPVPPPPPQMQKPVPPPPPRMGGQPAAPSVPPAMSAPAPAPGAPMNRPSAVPAPASMPGMSGMPGMGPSPLEQRIQEMEKRLHEQQSSKDSLETQLGVLGKQLSEEHEKVLMQNLRAKEEEALSARVEEQIRDMQ